MEQAAESELVPTPEESLMMSLVSPSDLSADVAQAEIQS